MTSRPLRRVVVPLVLLTTLVALPVIWASLTGPATDVSFSVDSTRFDFTFVKGPDLVPWSDAPVGALVVHQFGGVELSGADGECRIIGAAPQPAIVLKPRDQFARLELRGASLTQANPPENTPVSMEVRGPSPPTLALQMPNGSRLQFRLQPNSGLVCRRCSVGDTAEAVSDVQVGCVGSAMATVVGADAAGGVAVLLQYTSAVEFPVRGVVLRRPQFAGSFMVETKDSAVTNGELKFSGLPDRKLDIPAAAFVDVAPASDWRLTRLRVAPDGIAVALSGRTSHLTVEGRNVIPTYLDQLDGRFGWARRAVQTIVLLVTSVVSLWTWVSTRGKEGKA